MISLETQLLIAGILFIIGLVGLMVRRNLLFMLMSLEIMMNAAGFAFIAAGSHWMQTDGQVMFIFILTVAATEVSVALALVILMYKHFKTIDTSKLNELN
jgi:NADH-quinone oxidoreductase subunit K